MSNTHRKEDGATYRGRKPVLVKCPFGCNYQTGLQEMRFHQAHCLARPTPPLYRHVMFHDQGLTVKVTATKDGDSYQFAVEQVF